MDPLKNPLHLDRNYAEKYNSPLATLLIRWISIFIFDSLILR